MKSLVPVLACADRTLHVLDGSDIRYSVGLSGPPTTLEWFYGDGGDVGNELVYGTRGGELGLVQLGRYVHTHTHKEYNTMINHYQSSRKKQTSNSSAGVVATYSVLPVLF